MRLPLIGGNPLEFGDEIWRQKTRVFGLPDGEEIMTLAFFLATVFEILTLKARKSLNFLTPPFFEAPVRGEPLRIW